MSNLSDVKLRMAGDLANDKGGEATINEVTDFHIGPYEKTAADGMASTTTAAIRIWTNPYDFAVELIGGTAVGSAGLTADAANYAQISIQVDDGANGAPATALLWETTLTGTGTWTTDVAEQVTTRTAANATVAAGASVHFAIAKQGTGVVVPISSYTIRARRKV